jgi:hypothetical protein
MDTRGALTAFRDTYLAAGDDEERLSAIWGFRAGDLDALTDPDPAALRAVFEALLGHSGESGSDAELAAIRLIRILWRGLSRTALAAVFHDVSLALLDRCRTLPPSEREIAREAIDSGCEAVDPRLVEALCRELTAREVSRCCRSASCRGAGRAVPRAPIPDFEALRLVVRHSPAGLWSHLVRDLWRLYPPKRFRATGVERTAFWHDIARGMLRRTFEEAQPGDLGDAAPIFFAWVEDLDGMPDLEVEPLLRAMVAWPVPPVVRLLERLEQRSGTGWSSQRFRHKVAAAAREARAALEALGAEVAPAAVPEGQGSEAAPAPHSPVP